MSSTTPKESYHRGDNLITCFRDVLQSIFCQRWEQLSGSPWKPDLATEFISIGVGKNIYRNAQPIQKKLLESGKLKEWDITLLARVLREYFSSNKLYKEENDAIQRITSWRNKLAHNASKELSEDLYSKLEGDFKETMKVLKVGDTELEKLIKNAEATSAAQGWKLASEISKKGDKLVEKGKLEEAIKFFDEALQVPGLSNDNQAILLEKRGECNLALAEQNKGKKQTYLNLAEEDALSSLKKSASSWKAHFLLGQIYRHQNKVDEAISHLQKALSISPGQVPVKNELDSCKLLQGKQSREEHLDPRIQPRNMSEHLSEVRDKTGFNLKAENLSKFAKIADGFIPENDHVFQGHRYSQGWGVEQNYREAARHYSAAAKVNNAEGIYNLALLTFDGNGVKQDIPYAIELLKKAANMPIYPNRIQKQIGLPDCGVVAAQHSLGLRYEEGVGVPKDYKEAAKWYKKAAENGNGNAANNLGILYQNGNGVARDEKMAEMYWKLAVEKGDQHAAYSLCLLYQKQQDFKLAKVMLDRSVAMGNERLIPVREQILEQLDEGERLFKKVEKEMEETEKELNLEKGHLTNEERLQRFMELKEPETAKNLKVLKDIDDNAKDNSPAAKWAGKVNTGVDYEEILVKAANGSVTATRILETFMGTEIFEELWGSGPPFSEKEHLMKVINALYNCATLEPYLMSISPNIRPKLGPFLAKTLGLGSTSRNEELDRKLRLCYCTFEWVQDMDLAVEILNEGIRRYPEERHFYKVLTDVYGNLEDHRRGLQVALKGLQKFPGDYELLYSKAVHLRLLADYPSKEKLEQIQVAYQDFLDKAPEDHRKVPEAYYCLATSKLGNNPVKAFNEEGKGHEVIEDYEKGLASEKKQLSCYLPYESSSKSLLEMMVGLLKSRPGPSSKTLKGAKDAKKPNKGSLESPDTSKKSEGPIIKQYLKDPKRIMIIKEHRGTQNKMRNRPTYGTKILTTATPKFLQKAPKSLANLENIYLREMDPTIDKIYEGCIINLMIIEEPIFGMNSVICVAQDERGDATRLFVYNIPQIEDTFENRLGLGCKISITNPYHRIAADLKTCLRVDNLKCLIQMGKVENICRYCGEAGASSTCARCKKARYCGRECQEADWKVLKHKIICES